MLTTARKRVPGVAFAGVYQGFWGMEGVPDTAQSPQQVREQMVDFVREGAAGLIAFYHAGGRLSWSGWDGDDGVRQAITDVNLEIANTGGLMIPAEPDSLAQRRIQPIGVWKDPNVVAGVPQAWYVVTPFDSTDRPGIDTTFPPESGVDLDATYDGRGMKIRWNIRGTGGGVIGLGEIEGGQPPKLTAYATCKLTSPIQQDVQMRFSSSDDTVVWFDRKEVWRYVGERGIHFDQDIAFVNLPKGPTQILVKCYNRSGPWGFFMRFTDRDEALDGLGFSPKAEKHHTA